MSEQSSMVQEILNLDALSLNDEINSIRKGGQAGLSNAEKVIIHMRYLLTSRFEDSLE